MEFYLLLLLVITLTTSNTIQDGGFECMDVYGTNGQITNEKTCCGIRANGKRECHTSTANNAGWDLHEGKWRYCNNNVNTALNNGQDLCCDSGSVQDCSVCGAFVILPYETQTKLSNEYNDQLIQNGDIDGDGQNDDIGRGVTLSDKWQKEFEIAEESTPSFDVFPAGFIPATLKEFSDPPVCVYVPNSQGRMIEIKAEPEESGNRLCVSDLQDDVLGRNEAGQGTPCDETRLRTCFPDASDEKDFTFYVFCNNEGCAEGYDVLFWLRARVSEKTWQEGHDVAIDNVEMWCQYVLDEYPEWDIYPFDLEPYRPPPSTAINQNSTCSLTMFFTFALLLVFM